MADDFITPETYDFGPIEQPTWVRTRIPTVEREPINIMPVSTMPASRKTPWGKILLWGVAAVIVLGATGVVRLPNPFARRRRRRRRRS